VQLQDPVISPTSFDLVIVSGHDQLHGTNVLRARGALHRVTTNILHAAAEKLKSQVAHLPKPSIAVLIGGSNAVYHLTPKEMKPLAIQLRALVKTTGGSLLITPSRRTGVENLAVLQDVLEGTPAFIWDGEGENPYFGILGLADYILVTCDSVNMVSEAATTGKPVYVIDLPGGSPKFRRFHEAMFEGGFARPFEGVLETWAYDPLNDVGKIAERVREGIERHVSRV
jgi:mitochondrial fission protein ELM1